MLLKLLIRALCAALHGSCSICGEAIDWLLELGVGMQILSPMGHLFK